MDTENIRIIQDVWHEAFDDEYVPSVEGATTLLTGADDDLAIVLDAIDICATSEKMEGKAFEVRFSYIKGIIRNLKNSRLRQRYEDVKR